MKVNLPNQITLARLVLAIIFFIVLGQYSQQEPQSWLLDTCLAMFVIAAATDWLDGYYARKKNQITALGRILDPFVDKVLVCGAFVLLAGPSFCDADGGNVTGLETWMVVVIFGRELLVTGLRGFSESQGVQFGAEIVGKAKMWIQSVTIVVLLLAVAHGDAEHGLALFRVQQVFVWLTVLITAASLVTYIIKVKALLIEASAT
ncbi:MAG: CDP-diacylglycerol--glycerol-3-phosphate 3-phosphatidyltransferase [Phycisphaerae bacterium]